MDTKLVEFSTPAHKPSKAVLIPTLCREIPTSSTKIFSRTPFRIASMMENFSVKSAVKVVKIRNSTQIDVTWLANAL